MMGRPVAADDLPRADAAVDEWLFAVWSPDGDYGMISGHRLYGRRAWYWTAYVQQGFPLLHLAEFDVAVRPDWHVVKAPEMWAEHCCDEPLRQWAIGNEAHFAELDEADEALGRAYGIPRPTGFDLEWYAVGAPSELAAINQPDDGGGFQQVGVVHGLVEVLGRADNEVVEVPAHRWRRWCRGDRLPPVRLDAVMAHTGLRAPFRFPDGTSADWVVTPDGWRERPAETARAAR